VVNFPTHVQRLANGNTLITDAGNSRILEINPQGNLVWMVGLQRPMAGDDKGLRNPNSAIRLSNGNTLIADTGNNRVVEVDTKSNVVWQQPVAGPMFADRM
jgi:DNA-binding beta-propeller fold protein YncE